MTDKKPEPIYPQSKPNICPVCGQSSYSAAGIHPQCAAKQADEKRSALLKKQRSEAESTKKADGQKQTTRWQKTCPKCSKAQHVRKKQCECGHAFS